MREHFGGREQLGHRKEHLSLAVVSRAAPHPSPPSLKVNSPLTPERREPHGLAQHGHPKSLPEHSRLPGAARAGKDPSPGISACRAPKCSKKKDARRQPPPGETPTATCFGASLGSRGTNISTALWRSSGPHTLTHTPHMHTHTPLFSPYPIQNKAALTPGAPRASCSPPKPPSPAVPELTCSQAALFVCPRYLQPGAPALIPSARRRKLLT